MASHIPFVNSADDCRRLRRFYSDSKMLRVSLESIDAIRTRLPRKMGRWIDPGVDGYHHRLIKGTKTSPRYLTKFNDSELLADAQFLKSPDKHRLKSFVKSVLDKCYRFSPAWITVPQLPLVDDNSRNNINRNLAKATYEWKSKSNFEGKLILPLVFTHQNQLKGKTQWRKKLDAAKQCYKNAQANGVWVADCSLSDQDGWTTFRGRFSALIDFHEALRSFLPNKPTVIAGPYWGMNLILWARRLCDYPAIGLGTGYQYYIPGGPIKKGLVRIAVPPIRRWAVAAPPLREWLDSALEKVDRKSVAYKNFLYLKKNFDLLSNRDQAKDQVARFYKKWFDKLGAVPPRGRSLGLYQDLSSAYVLGRQLDDLPASGNAARKAERVAEYYMLNCL